MKYQVELHIADIIEVNGLEKEEAVEFAIDEIVNEYGVEYSQVSVFNVKEID